MAKRGGTPYDELTSAELQGAWQGWPEDIDAAFQFLVSQPGVKRDVIGVAGAGLLGVDNSVQAAHRHSAEVKSLVLLSGETFASHGRGDGIALYHLLQPGQKVPTLLRRKRRPAS